MSDSAVCNHTYISSTHPDASTNMSQEVRIVTTVLTIYIIGSQCEREHLLRVKWTRVSNILGGGKTLSTEKMFQILAAVLDRCRNKRTRLEFIFTTLSAHNETVSHVTRLESIHGNQEVDIVGSSADSQ